MKDAAAKIETEYLPFGAGIPRCIFLASDGYSKQFRDATAIDNGVMQVFDHLAKHGTEEFRRALTKLLESVTAQYTGDDVSVAMIVRSDQVPQLPTKAEQQRFL